MTKIAFIIDRIGYLEKFSIPIVASITQKSGYPTIVLEYSPNIQKTLAQLKSFQPDVIGYSVSSIESQNYLAINRLLKQNLSFFSLFGGPHATFFPEMINDPDIDAICRGEADIVLPQFLKNFGKPSMYRTSNFTFKKSGKIITNPLTDLIADLDSLPFPNRDVIYSQNPVLAQFPLKAFFAGRGCPYNCSYCFNHIYNRLYRGKGKVIRTKSVNYLIAEIQSVQKKYPMKYIKFHDDIFGLDQNWLAEFAEIYPQKIGLPFLSYSRANIITDEYCRLLKKAGCYSTSLAFECGDEKLRNTILNRNMINKQIIDGCKIIKKHGIKIYSLNMVGLPGENLKSIMKTVKLNQKIQVDFADASIFQPYPGTDLTQYCIDKGLVDKNSSNYESQFSKSVLKYSDNFKNQIYVLHKLFSILVDHPKTIKILPLLLKYKDNIVIQNMLNFFYRLYYGYFLQKRIYGFGIPISVRLQMAIPVLFSRSRA